VANIEQLKILEQGVLAWNMWRVSNPDALIDLRYVNLAEADLRNIDFNQANLNGAILNEANLERAKLRGAKLNKASLRKANLRKADLNGVRFHGANLSEAMLIGANLADAYFDETTLDGANVRGAHVTGTTFGNVDLSKVEELAAINHFGPSSVSIDTFYKSAGAIPETFLRGCGVPDDFIAFFQANFGNQQAIQFYSCFISYSTKDDEFAQKLYSRMRDEHLRVWFAPEDIRGGQKLFEQIERAIQSHDRLLLVLSEHSIQSEWVITEIRNARRIEAAEKRRKLFPIRLTKFDTLEMWKCFDGDSGKDLAVEIREYYIPDFSNWKDNVAFETAFSRLLHDLRAEEKI
jgi:uncharacterized protein YjbI with pentapeptide repeats